MDKLLEYCKARYDEELGFKFNLANIFAWTFFVVSSHIKSNDLSEVIFCGLSKIKLKDMLDVSDGVIPSLSMLQILYSVGFVVLSASLSKKMAEGLFYLFTLKNEFANLAADITLKFKSSQENDAYRKALGLGAKVELDRNIKKIRRTASLAESFLVISLATAFLTPMTYTNTLIIFAGAVLFTITTWSSFHFFTSSILPYHIATKYSTNELFKLSNSYNDTLKQ